MSTGMGTSAKNASFGFVRCLIAVLYRQAGLIALCALVGTAVSLALYARQPRVRASIAKVRVLAQARDDLRQCEDRIVALLVHDGGRGAGGGKAGSAAASAEDGLKLDLDPETAGTGNGAAPMAAAPQTRAPELQLRLDEVRQRDAGNAENALDLRSPGSGSQQRPAGAVRENTPLEAELDRLERARQLAQERFVALQRKLDRIDLYPRLNPAEAESRVVIDAAADRARPAEGRKNAIVALGTAAGLLLGLLLAGLRELGGERMRSPRDAERALGAPVLGAIPTLSAKARNACFGPSMGSPGVAPTELA
jgi:hypothetical protein